METASMEEAKELTGGDSAGDEGDSIGGEGVVVMAKVACAA